MRDADEAYKDKLIPVEEGDAVVAAVLHANKVVVVTAQGRVYKFDPFDGRVEKVLTVWKC
jgi:hypothetical protein